MTILYCDRGAHEYQSGPSTERPNPLAHDDCQRPSCVAEAEEKAKGKKGESHVASQEEGTVVTSTETPGASAPAAPAQVHTEANKRADLERLGHGKGKIDSKRGSR